jgi:hypothetical protein
MEKLQLTAVSLNREALEEYTREVKPILNKKAIEHSGPFDLKPLKPTTIRNNTSTEDWNDAVPDWIKDLSITPQELCDSIDIPSDSDSEPDAMLYSQGFYIRNLTPRQSQVVLGVKPDNSIHLSAEEIPMPTHSSGTNVPMGYDPNRDHQPHPDN